MKIIHLSDSHNKHNNLVLEDGDIVIHSGDATNMGTIPEVVDFLNWFGKLNYTHKLFVAGNHDWLFEKNPSLAKQLCKEHNVIWLNSEEIIINNIKFYGESSQPDFCSWAFNKPSHELLHSYANIPDDVNVLITHCPPKGIRDFLYNGSTVGSSELNIHLPRLKELKAHLFGHIHAAYGVSLIDGVQYSNAALCNEQYWSVNKPIEIFLDK